MAASFPNAKKTFTQIVNGVTKLIALIFNTGYDEIEAIETLIGALGCTSQSYTENLKNLLLGYRQGCEVYYTGVAEVKVKVGCIAIPDTSGNVRWRRNTSEVTVNWDNLDTGAEADNKYYVYAVADTSATTFTITISLSATTPTGATFYKLIGEFTNATDIISESVANVNHVVNAKLGNWIAKSVNTVYQAATDGSVVGYTTNTTLAFIAGFTDSNNPPTTLRARSRATISGACSVSIAFSVKKNDYWKVESASGEGTPIVFWIPSVSGN